MAKRTGTDNHTQFRAWRNQWCFPRDLRRFFVDDVGGEDPWPPVRSRGLQPSSWHHEPVEFAARTVAEEHPGGWLAGLAELADQLEIDVEGLLTSAIAIELRDRFGKEGGLDLRGKRPEFSGVEARDHLYFLDSVGDAARAAAKATDPASAVMEVLEDRWMLDRSEECEGLDGTSSADHLRQWTEKIVALLPTFKNRPAELAMRLLQEKEPRLCVAVENRADLRRKLTEAFKRQASWESPTYRKVRERAERLLRALPEDGRKPAP